MLFLLVHHLFYIQNGKFDDIELWGNHYLVNLIGQAGKVCVPLFVFLSGYGLTAGVEKAGTIDWKKFYIRRFSKLYFNYWLIWILFVPVGIVCFEISLGDRYGSHVISKFILDIFGLINITGHLGYNPTWWFYSCITFLYLFFPVIITACKSKWMTHVVLLLSVALVFTPFVPTAPIRYYLLTFVLGCFFCNGLIYNYLPSITVSDYVFRATDGRLTFWEIVALIILIVLSVPVRSLMPYAMIFDTIVAILIIFCFKNIRMHPYISSTLGFCGKHSFNIFLFHTFLFYLYIPQLIYWHRNPIIIFITLLLFCLTISVVIERGKEKLGYYKLLKQIVN